jgi:hypothetical protein
VIQGPGANSFLIRVNIIPDTNSVALREMTWGEIKALF